MLGTAGNSSLLRRAHYVEVFTMLGETHFKVHHWDHRKGDFDRDLLSPNMLKVFRVLGDLKHQVHMMFGS